jgi:hypothetical protein
MSTQPGGSILDRLPAKSATTTPAANPAGAGSASTADSYIAGLSSGTGVMSDPSDPPLLWRRATPRKKAGTAGSAAAADRDYGSAPDANGKSDPGDTLTLSDAENRIFASDGYRAQVAAQMVAAGLLDPSEVNDLGAIQSAWKDVVSQAASFYQAGNPRTPEEVIRLINIQKKAKAAPVPTTTTENTTQAQDFATTAPTDIRKALQTMLGRAPTSQEMQSYQAGLNSAAQANPQQQQTVTHNDGKGNITRDVTQSGGIDPTEVIGQMAQADPEYGAYQASTTYMDALRQAIQAFV